MDRGLRYARQRAYREWSAFYILKNGTETYRWYFDGADDIVHTVDELRGFTLTLNGEAVDCDPTKNVEVHEVNPSDLVGYEGQPSTWTVLQSEFTENGVTGYQYVIHPDNGKTPSVTYRFFYDAPDPVDELAGVTATLDDGSPVTGFDPLNEEDIFTIPSGHTVTLGNLPDGWTQTSAGNDRRTAVTLTKTDGGSITYLFDISDDYQWTYVITQLANVTAELADGTPVEGFGYRGGEWTLPQDATGVNLKNIPEGWNVNCVNEPTGSLPTEKILAVQCQQPGREDQRDLPVHHPPHLHRGRVGGRDGHSGREPCGGLHAHADGHMDGSPWLHSAPHRHPRRLGDDPRGQHACMDGHRAG